MLNRGGLRVHGVPRFAMPRIIALCLHLGTPFEKELISAKYFAWLAKI
ncbi:MAG: hypothetical protein ACRD7E_15345 [Bryobacteraceae bacterium]